MHDALFVGRLQGVRDLPGMSQRFSDWQRSMPETCGQRPSFHKLHRDAADVAGFLQSVNLGNVRMIERGERPRFAPETQQTFWISDEFAGKEFQRDVAIEFRIAPAIDLAHPAGSDGFENVVRSNSASDQHGPGSVYVQETCDADQWRAR